MPGPLNFPGLIMAPNAAAKVVMTNSCRFNDDDSAHTAKTLANRDGTLWTFSTWLKRGNLSAAMAIFSAGSSAGAEESTLRFTAGDKLQLEQITGSATVTDITTDAVYRDPGAWYHIVVAYDSDQAASADRITITVNGVAQAITETNAIDSGRTVHINENVAHAIGRNEPGTDEYFDGYLAETFFVDGSSLPATDFGEFHSRGYWVPVTRTGAYGNNGFHLDYKVAPGTGDGAGTDVSGNANHFADSGLAANDQRVDKPTNNHCTWNPLDTTAIVYSDGNLVATASAVELTRSTWALPSGKWYWEVNLDVADTAEVFVGVANELASKTGNLGADNYGWGLNNTAASVLKSNHNATNTTLTSTGTMVNGVYVMVAYDADTGKLWFGLDGSWLDSGDPGAGTNPIDTTDRLVGPAASGTNNEVMRLRTEEADFEGTMPAGFRPLNTSNLPEPAIPQSNMYFDVIGYTGDGVDGSAHSELNFSPDLVWIKYTTGVNPHILTDTVHGATKYVTSDGTLAEQTGADHLKSFTANGFTLGTNSRVNLNGGSYVAWCWKKDALSGFDIVNYTGSGVARTVGHALDDIPVFIAVKNRTSAVDWMAYQGNVLDGSGAPLADPETDYMKLNTDAVLADLNTIWNDLAPDQSNFNVGTVVDTNESGSSIGAYVWAEVEGFSKLVSYIGNGNADGPFVWLGFQPKFVMTKMTTGLGVRSWAIVDTQFSGVNPKGILLYPNLPSAQAAITSMDFLSNGIKIRTSNNQWNASGDEHMVLAFAENPFKYARAV